MSGQPDWKEQQLARGPKKPSRRRAGAKRWAEIAEKKQGPCRVCGGYALGGNQLHHLVSRAKLGSDCESNIVPLCGECHRRVTAYDREACAMLRRNLTDAEYAYANEILGEGRFEAIYPVRYEAA